MAVGWLSALTSRYNVKAGGGHLASTPSSSTSSSSSSSSSILSSLGNSITDIVSSSSSSPSSSTTSTSTTTSPHHHRHRHNRHRKIYDSFRLNDDNNDNIIDNRYDNLNNIIGSSTNKDDIYDNNDNNDNNNDDDDYDIFQRVGGSEKIGTRIKELRHNHGGEISWDGEINYNPVEEGYYSNERDLYDLHEGRTFPEEDFNKAETQSHQQRWWHSDNYSKMEVSRENLISQIGLSNSGDGLAGKSSILSRHGGKEMNRGVWSLSRSARNIVQASHDTETGLRAVAKRPVASQHQHQNQQQHHHHHQHHRQHHQHHSANNEKLPKSVPFNANENSNNAHFDAEFFPENSENEAWEFSSSQNSSSSDSNGNGSINITNSNSSSSSSSSNSNNNNNSSSSSRDTHMYTKDTAGTGYQSDDPFPSVPWGSSPTNNAPNVEEFQKEVYSNDYRTPRSHIDGHNKNNNNNNNNIFNNNNNNINTSPYISSNNDYNNYYNDNDNYYNNDNNNYNNNNINNNSSSSNNALFSSQENKNFFDFPSFFQDGNFTSPFSNEPVQSYHLDSFDTATTTNNNYNNDNNFNNISSSATVTASAAATASLPSSILNNMDVFAGTGSDVIFSFNETFSGDYSNFNLHTDMNANLSTILNRTDTDSSLSPDIYVWMLILMAPLVLFGIAGNTLVILAISLERRLQNITNYFLLSLAVTDLLVSLIVMPFSIINIITGRWLFGLLLCDFFVTSDVLMCTSSIFHLCFISAERYIGIRYPLWSKNKSKRVVLLKIVLVWTLAFAVTSPITVLGAVQEKNILVNGRCVLSNQYFIIYGSIFAFVIPLSIMVIMYILTVRMLSRQAKLCHKRRGEDGEVEPMIRRSTSSKQRWQGRNKFYSGGGGGGGGGGGEFQTSFRNHDVKEHILDCSGNFHLQPSMYDVSRGGGGGCGGGGGGGGGGGMRSNTLPHYKSGMSPRRGCLNIHEGVSSGRGGSSVILSTATTGTSPMNKRQLIKMNGTAGTTTSSSCPSSSNKNNNNRSPCCASSSMLHQDTLAVHAKNSKNGKQCPHHSASAGRVSRRLKGGGILTDVIGKRGGNADGRGTTNTTSKRSKSKSKNKNNKSKSNTSEYQFCNGHQSDSSGEDTSISKDDGSGNRSSSPSDNNNKRLKDLVKKHHVALKAANILLMRRVDGNSPQGQGHNNLHHTMTSSGLPRILTTTPPSSTKVSIRRDNSVKTEQKASKVLGMVFIIFVVCWTPFFTVNILQVLCSNCNLSDTLFTAFVWLGYVSSTLNPIIYTIFNNIFRNTFIKLLCCRYRLLHRARRNSNIARKENGMLASSTCSATYNTASTILTSASSNGGNSCNISFRNKATSSLNVMEESKC